MPKYDFKCETCQKTCESFFPIEDGPAPAVMCDCGGEAFRVYSNFGIQFKGSGFYKTGG